MDRGASDPGKGQITGLLKQVADDVEGAPEALFECVYTELHRRANALMHRQPNEHTLQPTALVSELYLRLFDGAKGPWADRGHFLRAASRAMRHILVEYARRKASDKRGNNPDRAPMDEVFLAYEDRSLDLLALQEALERLEGFDPEMARAVELRFFGGSTMQETSELLEIPDRTFARRWQMTRAWLYREIR